MYHPYLDRSNLFRRAICSNTAPEVEMVGVKGWTRQIVTALASRLC